MNPLVSVVIPTAGRPRFLSRAVESALTGMAREEVEVIVVPNGPDQSWVQSLAKFKGQSAVRTEPIEIANANIARTHGLRSARGKYVRFLDDDDFLYPEACRGQYEALESGSADICSGEVDYVDARGRIFVHSTQPETDDFTVATISPKRSALPVMHVFRRSILRDTTWRESQPFLQDVQWLFDVCAKADYKWVKVRKTTGVWQHHWGNRVSRFMNVHVKQLHIARMIRELTDTLESTGRMTPARHQAIAEGLWHCIHMAYFRSPVYWGRFARKVLESYPESRPNIGFYHVPSLHGVDPILVETIMMPKRWMNYVVRSVGDRLRLRHMR